MLCLKVQKMLKKFLFSRKCWDKLISKNVNIDINNFEEIKKYIKENKIDLIVVGPEKPLVDGIVDYLESFGIKVFGPNRLHHNLKVQKYLQKIYVRSINPNS